MQGIQIISRMFMTRPVRPRLTPGSIYGRQLPRGEIRRAALLPRARDEALACGHEGEDWAALMKHLNPALDKFKVPAKEHGEVAGFIESTKADIVEVR